MRRHLTYANVAATAALVLAMSGGALAAGHYLINSTRQINPRVLKKLRGNTGPRGARGPQGLSGPSGSMLASGQTITGSFAATDPPGTEGGRLVATISFPSALTTNPTNEVSLSGGSLPGCPGTDSSPAAERGHLCIYMSYMTDVMVAGPDVKGTTPGQGDFRFGAAVYVPVAAGPCKTCEPSMFGTWAYTAP